MIRRGATCLLLLAAGRLGAAVYYLDCSNGSNSANGLSPESAWGTLAAFNGREFAAGDSLLLRRGTRCAGMLSPGGSGTSNAPITLGAFGAGAAPVIDGGTSESAIRLFNQQGWRVENIETTGGLRYGIHVGGDSFPMNHFRITNVNVHDVYGPLTAKESGLIVLHATKSGAMINDVIIDGATAWNTTQWAGIEVVGAYYKQSLDGPHGANITIRDSVVHDVYGDGIVLFLVQNGLIEKSAAWRTGQQPTKTIGTPSAIWTWMCNECTVQFSESWLSSSPAVDGGAFDIDWGNRNNLVQFNYGHESKSYCASIFGAERLATTGAIRDNLCIANSQGVTSGEDFEYYTWNSGWIAGSSIDHNVSCLTAPVDNPLLWATTAYNALDLRGVNRFHHNTAYSTGTLLVDAFSPLDLNFNSYWSTVAGNPRFRFNGKSYDDFGAYQAGSAQDADSTYGPMVASPDEPGDGLPAEILDRYRGAGLLFAVLDSSSDALSQLVVLRSMMVQYAKQGLQVAVAGNPAPEWLLDQVALVKDDELANRLGVQRIPATFLIDAQGSIVKRWDGYAPFFQVGPAVSRLLSAELVPGCPAERAMRLPVLRELQVGQEGAAAPGDLIRILGANLAGVDGDLSQTRVFFGAAAASPQDTADGVLIVRVPDGATPGIVRVQVEYKGVNSSALPLTVANPAPPEPQVVRSS